MWINPNLKINPQYFPTYKNLYKTVQNTYFSVKECKIEVENRFILLYNIIYYKIKK